MSIIPSDIGGELSWKRPEGRILVQSRKRYEDLGDRLAVPGVVCPTPTSVFWSVITKQLTPAIWTELFQAVQLL